MSLPPHTDNRTLSPPPASPPAPRTPNGARKSELQDKIEMEPEPSGGIHEKYTPSNGSRPYTESIRDVLADVDSPGPPGAPSASGDHPESNQASATTEDLTKTGSDIMDAIAETVPLPSATTEFDKPHPPQERLEPSSGATSPHDTRRSEVGDRSTSASRQHSPLLQSLVSAPSQNGTHSNADASSAEDVVMTARDRNTSSDDQASDSHEDPPKSTKSNHRRPPDTILQGPAKRARTSSATSSPVTTPNPNIRGSDEDIQMRDSPSVPISDASSNTEAVQQTDTVDADPVCDSSIASSQTTPEINSNSDSNPAPSLGSPSKVAQPASTSSRPQSPGPSKSPTLDKSPQNKPTTPSAPSLANNPYFALSTAFLKGATNSTSTGYNPYSLYYGPGTPISPHTPTYPYPYLYQVHSPVSAAMYPTSPSFVTSPTQKSPSPLTPPTAEPPRQKPKRLKAHTVTSGNHNIPIVPRDKKGRPMLPLNVGIMTVIGLGEVCMREHFHTERYIFPVGYEVTRRYLSTVDPNTEVVYHCTILDGGDGPKFQIVPSDAPGREVIAGTATGAWSSIVKQANAIRSRQHSNSVSGPDFFGLGQNTIKHLIQELPNADRLKDYVWQNFIEGGPLGGRHAAVTPALPEDYDSTLPIGALYPPPERDRLKREVATSPRGLNHYPQHIIAQAEAQAQRKDLGGQQLPGQQQLVPPEGALPVPNGHASMLPHSPGQLLGPGTVMSPSQPPAPAPPNTQAPASSVPATIASIMSAYPAPAASPPVVASSSTPPPDSASSLPS